MTSDWGHWQPRSFTRHKTRPIKVGAHSNFDHNLANMPATFFILCASIILVAAHPIDDRPQANTTSGLLTGIRVSTQLGPVDQFLGVPYAQPPTGPLRFQPPKPLDQSLEKLQVDRFAPSCMQPPHLATVMYPQILRNESLLPNSEDCLYLNIYVPPTNNKAADHPLPIMVWFPGEGYNYASARQFDGSRLALDGKVIVITVNYRVSAFGFLSTGTSDAVGNLGLWDQITSLRWIRHNAKAFGGDSASVTLVGRFTGAMSATVLLASPLAMYEGSPLFHRVIAQSGVADVGSWIFDQDPIRGARKLATTVGCSDTHSIHQMMHCLTKVDAETLNAASSFLYSWRLVFDDTIIPQEPLHAIRNGKQLPIPVMLGNTNDEGSICVMTQKLMQSPELAKLLDDDLNQHDFAILARGFFDGYLNTDEESVDIAVEDAIKQYKKIPGTWRDRYVKLCGDGYIKHKTKTFARQLSIHGSRVFLYEFVHRPQQSIHPDFVRAGHGDDILFTFGLVQDSHQSTEAEKILSNEMITAWTNFVKSGNPNPMLDTNKEWPAFSISNKHYWEFSTLDDERVKTMHDNKADNFISGITKTGRNMINNSLDH